MKKMRAGLLGLAALAMQAAAASDPHIWTVYDNFNTGPLNMSKWSLEVENSSANPSVSSGRVNCSAVLNDGVCKIGVTDKSVYGVRADFILGSAVNDSGIEMEVYLSNGGVGYLDCCKWNGQLYISADFYDADEQPLLEQLWTGTVAYNTTYTLAVVVEDGRIKCYVNNQFLGESDAIEGITPTAFQLGTWSDVDGANVAGWIDNASVLRASSGIFADSEFDYFYYPAAGVDEFQSGTYSIFPYWWFGLGSAGNTPAFVQTIQFNAPYPFDAVYPTPDSVVGNQYTWNNVMISSDNGTDFAAFQSSVQKNTTIPASIVRDWSPRVLTESGNVTFTITVTPTADWNYLGVEMHLFNMIHDSVPDWTIAPFANLSFVSESHSAGILEYSWDGTGYQEADWEFSNPTIGQPITLTMTIHYELINGSGPIAIEPFVDFEGYLAADYGTETWTGGTANMDGTCSIVLSTVPTETDHYLPWLGVEFHSSATGSSDADLDQMPDAWEQQIVDASGGAFTNVNQVLPNDDFDNDGLSNRAEYIAGTIPTNGNSVFNVAATGRVPSGFVLNWTAVDGRLYGVKWAGSLTNAFQSLATNIAYPVHSYTDTTHNAQTKGYYKIDVRLE